MALEDFEDPPKPTRSGGRLVVAGVVGACALGVGLGLWARPQPSERGLGAMTPEEAPAAAPEPARTLEIVVADAPPPVRSPLEVLSGQLAAAPRTTAELRVLRGAPDGLMKVAAPLPVTVIAPGEPPAAAEPAPVKAVRVAARPEPKPSKAEVAKASALKKAERRAAEKKKAIEVAKAEKAEHEAARREKARHEQAAAEARKQSRLAALMRKVKTAQAKLKQETERRHAAELRLARAKAEAARKEKARKAHQAEVLKASARKPKPAPPKPHGEGPLKMVRNSCVSADPGAALVCADPRLSVRERQLQRAYHAAEAAGVPAAELARQQRRWLAARAAAAREAPWAVEEVYEARIAELNDLSRR
jgi:hypothetical protein